MATVEFALVAIFLLLPILAGIIQFGITYSQYQLMQGAAREGARCAAVEATPFNDCEWQDAVDSAAQPYELSETPTVQVDGLPPGSVCTGDTIGRDVTVSWDQTFELSFLRFIPVVPDSVTTEISGTFRCE